MPAKLIPNEALGVVLDRTRTRAQAVAYLKDEFGVDVSENAISVTRIRKGNDRAVRYNRFVPWRLRPEHRGLSDVVCLRIAARIDAGGSVTEREQQRMATWHAGLAARDEVVHYIRAEGFLHVARRPGVDFGLIREPGRG